ncbi:MAG TPA: outer membrane protein assembly factor BamA [Thermoanaerobaculia bacterium]|nr:outer membrane protein assembly factor BamA [Thermoanaerobaculia bacterium]
MRLWVRAVLILLLGALAAGSGFAQEVPPAGPAVTSIEIRSDAPLADVQELESLIEIEVGQPLEEEAVRHTLRNLQASGTASEIEVYAREEEGGVVAVIVFRAVVQVEEIRFEGELGGLSRADLTRAVPQKVAEPLSEERVVRGVFNLLDFYHDNGYLKAVVRVDPEIDPERRRAVVTYAVESGPRATVRTIGFTNPVEPFAPAALVQELRVRLGEPFQRRGARDSAERLQAWLVRQGYGAARVDPPQEVYDPEANRVDLTYPIEIGPKIAVILNGADEKALRRRGLLTFLGQGGYDEALLLQSVNRIRTWYQQQGHYRVQVASEERPANGTLEIVITIEPGPEYTLEEVDFAGNEEVSDDRLLELMATAPRSLLRPGSGRLVQEELDEDLDNMRRYYALQGYWQAEVDDPVVEETGPGNLKLTIPIREGLQRRVVNLRFEGMEALDPAGLLRRLPLKEGGPFHPTLLENTVDAIRAAYAEKGYAEAQVSAREDWNPDRTRVDVTIQVLEGAQRLVDRVILRGNQRTSSDVIRRTIDLDTGEPVSDTRLLEIERNLYRLGIFSRVDVELLPAGLGSSERDVLIRVEEGLPRTVTYGLGWDSEAGPRGLFGFSNNNVGGRAYSLRTDLRLSEEDSRFRFIVNRPYLGPYPVELTSTVFWEDVAERDRPYEVTRYGARTEAVRVFGNRRVSLGLDYRRIELEVDPGVAANDIERRDQPYELTSLVPSFFWDRRDDPITPTEGWSSLVQLQYAFPAFNTDTEFLKLFLQQTQYLDLGRPGVIAASVRFGGIEPFTTFRSFPGDPLAGFASRNVPIAERFFAGGDVTHRAYARDELGLRGETLIFDPDSGAENPYQPVGGNGLLLVNLEYRFPLFGPIGGTLFYDTGNVWADWQSIDFGGLKNGAGVGVQYLSPIGPIRAGIGWKLDREPGEDPYYLFLNIGNPF